jgi:hypothetical protein
MKELFQALSFLYLTLTVCVPIIYVAFRNSVIIYFFIYFFKFLEYLGMPWSQVLFRKLRHHVEFDLLYSLCGGLLINAVLFFGLSWILSGGKPSVDNHKRIPKFTPGENENTRIWRELCKNRKALANRTKIHKP